jgi:hypothetical protein
MTQSEHTARKAIAREKVRRANRAHTAKRQSSSDGRRKQCRMQGRGRQAAGEFAPCVATATDRGAAYALR